MKFEMKRKIDEMGRVVLPNDLRNHYQIQSGDKMMLVPVKEGIYVVKCNSLALEQVPHNMTVTVDELGRIVVPTAYMNYYGLKFKDQMSLFPTEECILMIKSKGGEENV